MARTPPAHAAQTSMAATLRVTVDGVSAAGGNLVIGLYDEATFPVTPDAPLFSKSISNARGTATAVFDRLPPGAYAVRAFQDLNRDGGPEPGEPSGLSNGAAPDNFDAAAIALHPGENAAAIHLH